VTSDDLESDTQGCRSHDAPAKAELGPQEQLLLSVAPLST
jgi:hypothetical protein